MPGPPKGTITFLFTDIEGSTRLWERSPQAMQSALARHDEILRSAVEAHSGYVFKTVGDAFCAAFATAPEALEAALEAQLALSTDEWGETGPLRVRMALHPGAAEERDGDYFGPPLNRVARLLSAAHGGQVLLSLPTQELVRDQLPPGTGLHDLGEHRLKDLFRPEHVFQVVAPGLPEEFPPLRTLESRPNNLPLQPTPLIGREREVEEVRGRLLRPEVRLLTLTGPGGTGKTRLALQVAAEVLDEFPDGAFFVPLAAVGDPRLVASAIAGTLGVVEVGDKPLVESLKDHLRERRMLLVLDNFEQVMEATPLLDELMLAAPGLKLLGTSRSPLRLYGERSFPVSPLSVPDPRRLPDVQTLSQYEAVRLFIERAQDAKPDFNVTSENAPAVAEICARLDGLPLAIELAAARVRMLPPQKMLQRLANRLKLLKGGARDLPTRQQTLRGAIDWSHDLLEEHEKTLFRRLSVFAGGRTLEAVEEVCDIEGDLDVWDGVESLLEKSLLRQEEGAGGEPRFVMLETVHEYAREKLGESGEAEAIERAHAEYFLALAEEAEPKLKGPQQIEWMDRLEAEHDNLRAAMSRALQRGEAELELCLAGALWWFWQWRGHLIEGRRWLEEALKQKRFESAKTRAKALSGVGFIATAQGEFQRAVEPLEESLAQYRELGDRAGTASALAFLGYVEEFRGDIERAKALGEEALELSRRLGDTWNTTFALNLVARTAYDRGDREEAAALWEESLALARKTGDTWSISWALRDLGWLALVGGDLGRAAAIYEETLETDRMLRDKIGVSMSLCNLGWAVLLQGDYERARTLFKETLELSRELDRMDMLAECLEGMAGVAAAQGDAERTALIWGAADALREEIAVPIFDSELPLHESYRAFARSQLDEATFRAAFEEGRNLTAQQVIDHAQEGEGGEGPRTEEAPA